MNTPTEPSARPARLSVGIVGTGRVGSVLGAALARAGHRVAAATAISDASRKRLEHWLPGVPALAADEVLAAAELVLLTVPDDTLPGLVEGLAGTGSWRPGQLVVHTSGTHGLAALEPATRAGALPLALHPVLPFQDRDEDLDRLDGISWGVTAPEPLRLIAEALVVEMGGEPCWVVDEYRALYHAGLAIGANHLVTLIGDAVDTLRAAGVEQPARMLAPLLSAALDNALRHGDAALTGPVARGDAGTVARHRHVLAAVAPPVVPAYVAMARRTADRALAAGLLRPEQAEALLDVLGSTP